MKNNEAILDYDSIGKRLKKCRKQRKWTQSKMAMELGYSTAYYNTIENGKAHKINEKSLMKIAKMLDIDLDWLLNGTINNNSQVNDPKMDFLLFPEESNTPVLIEMKSNDSRKSRIVNLLSYYINLLDDVNTKDKSDSRIILDMMVTFLPKLVTEDLDSLICIANGQKQMRMQ